MVKEPFSVSRRFAAHERPQSNTPRETMNGVVAHVAGEICAAELGSWDLSLKEATFKYNTKVNSAMGKSPYVVALGRSCVTWVDRVLSKIGLATAVDPNHKKAVVAPDDKEEGQLILKTGQVRAEIGRDVQERQEKIMREIKLTTIKNAASGTLNLK